MKKIVFSACVILAMSGEMALGQAGVFPDHQDVGAVSKPGSVKFEPAKGQYLVAGSGENMWMTNDAFQFVWTKMSGDFTLAADIKFPMPGGNAHRKACLMVRQSLDADAAYVDVAVHGIGLTSLQFRDAKGELTHEIRAGVSAPERVRIEKHGDYISLSLAATNDTLRPAGVMYKHVFQEPYYVGLAVCAHDNKTIEQAAFANVELKAIPSGENKPVIESALEIVPIASTDRRVVYHTPDHIEAPNWSRDGKYFLFNSNGRIYRLPADGGAPEVVDTGSAVSCNNDHGISPDGMRLAVSAASPGDKQSRIYVLPAGGGVAQLVTPLGPSYWHGWSPDGKTLAYCGERKGEFDVYTIPVTGGKETRMTTAPELDDGPDYSADGKYIYFNSERTGRMQIWRMKPDGSDKDQITSDDYNNWFAHPSPDGQWIVFLSYEKSVKGHPANQDVILRLMSLPERNIRVLAKLFGGQGTINVPSWSPDSKDVAFVSYQMIYP